MDDNFKQILHVLSDEYDDYPEGQGSFQIHYILFEVREEMECGTGGFIFHDLYSDDGKGNGVRICRFDRRRDALFTLKLGKFVEYEAPVAVTPESMIQAIREKFAKTPGWRQHSNDYDPDALLLEIARIVGEMRP
jgi:hypothetical protein